MEDSGGRTSQGATLGGRTSWNGWLNTHYVLFFEGTFAAVAFLNIIDLWTSSIALNQGLSEGNGVIIGVAGIFGLQIIGGLLVMKVLAIFGGLVAAVVGIRTRHRQTRVLAVAVMLFLMMVLIAVSVNNLYLISVN